MKIKKILIMAGGTGGHVFPALAVAEALRSQQVEIHWLGTSQGIENTLVPAANIPLHYIKINGIRGKGLSRKLLTVWNLLLAIIQSDRIIRELKPDVVLGMGGYASGPGGLAAWFLRIPLVIHEQNAAAGFTNHVLAKIATKVLQAFPNVFPPKYKAILVGNPVRQEILQLPAPELRFKERTGPIRLLVLGGSQGAESINNYVPAALAALASENSLEIWHQAGTKHLVKTQQNYAELNLKAKVDAFIENMAEAYSWADLVICRAGALTIAELSAVGLGSILVPFPYAVDDHQTANAEYLETIAAAKILTDQRLVLGELQAILAPLLQNRRHLLAMANAAQMLSPSHSVANIVGEINAIVRIKK